MQRIKDVDSIWFTKKKKKKMKSKLEKEKQKNERISSNFN